MVLFPLLAWILNLLRQRVRMVLEYKAPVAVFRVLRGYSFPGVYEGLSTQKYHWDFLRELRNPYEESGIYYSEAWCFSQMLFNNVGCSY